MVVDKTTKIFLILMVLLGVCCLASPIETPVLEINEFDNESSDGIFDFENENSVEYIRIDKSGNKGDLKMYASDGSEADSEDVEAKIEIKRGLSTDNEIIEKQTSSTKKTNWIQDQFENESADGIFDFEHENSLQHTIEDRSEYEGDEEPVDLSDEAKIEIKRDLSADNEILVKTTVKQNTIIVVDSDNEDMENGKEKIFEGKASNELTSVSEIEDWIKDAPTFKENHVYTILHYKKKGDKWNNTLRIKVDDGKIKYFEDHRSEPNVEMKKKIFLDDVVDTKIVSVYANTKGKKIKTFPNKRISNE